MVQKTKKEQQNETNNLWNQIKKGLKTYDSVMNEISLKSLQNKSRLLSFWGQACAAKSSLSQGAQSKDQITRANDQQIIPAETNDEQEIMDKTEINLDPASETPKQNNVSSEINQLQDKLLALIRIRDSGLMTDVLSNKMKSIKSDLKKRKNQLKRLKEEAVRKRKRRAEMKRTLEEISTDVSDLAQKLRKFTRNKIGKPAI